MAPRERVVLEVVLGHLVGLLMVGTLIAFGDDIPFAGQFWIAGLLIVALLAVRQRRAFAVSAAMMLLFPQGTRLGLLLFG